MESYDVFKDCFVSYESTQSDHIESIYRTEDHVWTPFTELPIVLIYNNKLVDAASAPRGFEDLFDGNWDGKVSFADPGRSGSSCTMLETMIQVLPMREMRSWNSLPECSAAGWRRGQAPCSMRCQREHIWLV